jgi:hypothetical protein
MQGEGEGPRDLMGPSGRGPLYGFERGDFSLASDPGNEVTNPLLTRLSGDMLKNQKHEKD